jgi:hypothetical protein
VDTISLITVTCASLGFCVTEQYDKGTQEHDLGVLLTVAGFIAAFASLALHH